MSEIVKIVPADDLTIMLEQAINSHITDGDTVEDLQIDHHQIDGDGKTIVVGDGVCHHTNGVHEDRFEFDFEINAGTSSSAPVILGDLEVVIDL